MTTAIPSQKQHIKPRRTSAQSRLSIVVLVCAVLSFCAVTLPSSPAQAAQNNEPPARSTADLEKRPEVVRAYADIKALSSGERLRDAIMKTEGAPYVRPCEARHHIVSRPFFTCLADLHLSERGSSLEEELVRVGRAEAATGPGKPLQRNEIRPVESAAKLGRENVSQTLVARTRAAAKFQPSPCANVPMSSDWLIISGDPTVRGDNSGFQLIIGLGANRLCGEGGTDAILGHIGDQEMFGGSGADLMFGGAGNDVMFGDSGVDLVIGEDGNDTIFGGSGTDVLGGGEHQDIVRGNSGVDVVSGGGSNDVLNGDSGTDFVFGDLFNLNIAAVELGQVGDLFPGLEASLNHLIGQISGSTVGNDTIFGNDGWDALFGNGATASGSDSDVISGGNGWDWIYGENGNDDLRGDNGTDHLYGGAGNDTMNGNSGVDWLKGGPGEDFGNGGGWGPDWCDNTVESTQNCM